MLVENKSQPVVRERFRRVPWWVLAVVGMAGLGLGLGGLWLHHRLVRFVRAELLPEWSEDYASNVTLDHLTVGVFPSVRVVGDGLTFRLRGRETAPPLVHARRITVTAGIAGLLGSPLHLHMIRAEGLELNVPPDRPWHESRNETARSKFFVDEILADNSVLRSLPKRSGDKPLEFDFHQVRLRGGRGVDSDLSFHTEVKNAKPPGLIRADGRFGPWNATTFAPMRVSGKFDFSDVNLGAFQPVLGLLFAKGDFTGTLGHINVSGTAEIPAFEARNARHPIDFRATYRAVVDGTNGDTTIQQIDGQFLRSHITAHGEISGKDAKTVSLDAQMERGRLEDILRFVIHDATPPFTGAASFHWRFTAPLTSPDMVDQMRIEGSAGLGAVQPTRSELRRKVDELSAKGQGEPKAADEINALSDLRGRIDVHDGLAHLSDVSFRTPGVFVTMHGTYALRSESLNIAGTARLEKELSKTATGIKSAFLKIVDPFFKRKHAAAAVPIRITGTARNPNVRTDIF